jgi:branched-chain amino acid transport system substrate-binding protein
MKVPAIIVGHVMGACSPRAWKLIGSEVEYCIQEEAPIGSAIPLKRVPRTRKFVEAFIEKYGTPRGLWLSGSAYDGTYILAEAIERAGSLDAEKIVSELEKTDYRGASGRLRFDENHQVIYGSNPDETGVCLSFQWQAGKMVPIYPPTVAEGKVLLPPWMK